MIGRGEVLDRIGRALRRGPGAFVAGRGGVGVSSVLRAVVEAERAGGRTVRHAVGSWPAGAAEALVVVDDAHLLDGAAADALRDEVLNDGRLVVVGTTDPAAGAAALSWLWTSGTLTWVDVAPLGRDDVAAVVAEAVGAPPDGVTAAALDADCGGLPALLVPAVDAALDGGALSVRTGCARLSGPVPTSPALRGRVRSLVARVEHPAAAEVLGLVCTARRLPLPFPGADPAVLTELVDRGLVAVDGDVAPVARPAARAIARVVQADLGPGGLAAAAERLLAGAGGAPSADRARWRALAGEDVASSDLAAAAAECRNRGELFDAEALAGRAAAGGDPAATLLHAELLAALGRRRDAATRLGPVVAAGEGDPVALAMCRFELATLLLWNLHEGDRAVALVDQLLDLPAPPEVVPRLRAAVASIHAYAGHPREALARLDELVEGPDRYDEHLVDHVLAVARALTGATGAAVDDARRGLARAADDDGAAPSGDPEIHVLSCTLAMGEAGLIGPAAALAAEWHGRAVERGLHGGWMALARARVALAAGDLDGAERFGREAEADFADLDNQVPRRLAVAARLLAAAQCGDAALAAALRERLDGLEEVAVRFLEPEVERARAWELAAVGTVSAARAELDRIGRAALEAGLPTLAMGAHHDAVRMGAPEAADAVLALHGTVDGALAEARLAHAAALLAGDAAGLLDAAVGFGDLGAHLCAADAAAQAVERARRRADGIDPRRARAVCNEHRARCAGAATPALRALGAAQLSSREGEVARLAAGGMASRAIAEQLGISVRTVDNLLQRAYAKLGVHDRAALGAALAVQQP